MTKLESVLPILFLSILVLVGAGCGQSTLPTDGSGSQAPVSDVAGQDISGVPRYPGAVRISYGYAPYAENITIVEYLASASVDAVSDFYEMRLAANGWVSPVDEETMQMLGLSYKYVGQALEKGNQQVFILIGESEEYSGHTLINITSGPK